MEESQYLSYLLRLWPVNVEGRTVWRASLESSLTGGRMGFSDVEALFNYLEQTLQSIQIDRNAPLERESE